MKKIEKVLILLFYTSTLFESLIEDEIYRKVNFHKSQFGFRKNGSCAHVLFTFFEACNYAEKKHLPMFCFFLDYSKAFHKVNRSKMFYQLIKDLNPHYWLALVNYCDVSKIYIITKDGEIRQESIKTTVGVKQGGKVSPKLFNKYVDPVLIIIEESGTVLLLGGVPVGEIVYADDTTLCCTNRAKAEIISKFCDIHDITINVKNTKWMRINTQSKKQFYLNGDIIEKVTEFKLIGFIICDNLNHKKHVKKRRAMCIGAVKDLDILGFTEHIVSSKMKSLCYSSLARSKLMYGMENVNLGPNELKNLKTFDANFIKRANGLSTRSRSTALLYSVGLSSLPIALLKRKISFLIALFKNEMTRNFLAKCKSYKQE